MFLNTLKNILSVQSESLKMRLKRPNPKTALFLCAVLCFGFIIVFSYAPLLGWLIAFFDYKPGVKLSQTAFTGLKFFKMAVLEPELLMVIRNTLVLSFLSLLSTPIPVFFAILLSEMRSTKAKRLVQTITTLPNFISWVLVYSIMFALFSVNDGLVNNVLIKAGMIKNATNFLADSDAVWIFQTLVALWKGLGYTAIIYFAAITSIDCELYDAAAIDGAGRFAKIKHITIPGLYSTYVVILVLSIGALLSNGFEQYYLFYNPVIHDKIQTLDYYVYRVGIKQGDFPVSTALGISKAFVSFILLTFANLISKKLRGEYIF